MVLQLQRHAQCVENCVSCLLGRHAPNGRLGALAQGSIEDFTRASLVVLLGASHRDGCGPAGVTAYAEILECLIVLKQVSGGDLMTLGASWCALRVTEMSLLRERSDFLWLRCLLI